MKTVLIVDDEPHMRRLIAFALARLDASLLQAASGPEALRQFQAGRVDLMVADVGMEGMDGLALVRELRAQPGGAALPIVMLTGRGHPAPREDAANLGVAGFLTKPFSPSELAAHAARLLATA